MPEYHILNDEIELKAVRSRGPGGQTSTRCHQLAPSFDVSGLFTDFIKENGQAKRQKADKDGLAVTAPGTRKNREDALRRLRVSDAGLTERKSPRDQTNARGHRRRLENKSRRSDLKD